MVDEVVVVSKVWFVKVSNGVEDKIGLIICIKLDGVFIVKSL